MVLSECNKLITSTITLSPLHTYGQVNDLKEVLGFGVRMFDNQPRIGVQRFFIVLEEYVTKCYVARYIFICAPNPNGTLATVSTADRDRDRDRAKKPRLNKVYAVSGGH